MVEISGPQVGPAATAQRAARADWPGWGPVSGFAFVILFVTSVLVQNTPNPNSPDVQWTDYFASAGNRAQIFIGCVLGVVAALALLSFMVIIWMRVTAIRRNDTGLLPVAAATVAATSIAVGMTIQAVIPGTMIFNGLPEPSAAILRIMENIAPVLVEGGGMLALTLAIASLAVQARRAGAFGRRMTIFSTVIAVLTFAASFQFLLVLAPLIWTVVVSVLLIRRPALAQGS